MPETKLPSDPRWIWPFELIERIGEGGMGVVYRARYVVNNRHVAVKMLPGDVSDKTVLARFERELEVLKNLKHPNIVRCFGGVCEDKQRFYAMELVEGGNLDEVLQRRGRFTWEQVVDYGLQMCAALECSHQAGVVHRDIKPGNFLIGPNGQIKLSDFGLASVVASRKITAAGKTAGTFLYMAPEQIRGGAVTPQTDLYALGCVFFELLTGRPPFMGETPAATLHAHCKEPAPRISAHVFDCPVVLEQLIARMLEKDPANRPQSAVEVARELKQVTQTITVVAPKTYGADRRVSQHPLTVGNKRRSGDEPDDEAVPETPPTWTLPRWMIAAAFVPTAVLLLTTVSLWKDHGLSARWERLWLEAMTSEQTNVQVAAAAALGEMGAASGEGMKLLEAGLNDNDPAVRLACLQAITRIGPPARGARPALLRVQQKDAVDQVRTAAAEAIRAVDESASSSAWPRTLLALLLVAFAIVGVWYWRRQIAPAQAVAEPVASGRSRYQLS